MIHDNILYLNTAFVTVHWQKWPGRDKVIGRPPDHINPGSYVFTIIKTTT